MTIGEKKEKIASAIFRLCKEGKLTICEPCQHDKNFQHDGINCHEIIDLLIISGKIFVKFSSTSPYEFTQGNEYKETDNAFAIIAHAADWL